ncbi:hypothetical protein ACFP3Q_02620 [Nocardioides sp. GCM10027113]|uniref:hypothetical protein n=1 Tax=unclassified Nocardioides TaxID=2615069 RepID=UPI003623FAFF
MTTRSTRHFALATAGTLVAGLLAVTPSAATAQEATDAHWRTVTAFKKAKTQLCLDPEAGGWSQVIFRHQARNAERTTRTLVSVRGPRKLILVGTTDWVRPGETTTPDGGTELTGRQVKRYRAHAEIELRNGKTRREGIRVKRLPDC